jgi:hypothetical protein
MTLQQLKEELPRLSEPENVLVWRLGFEQWVEATEVPELKAQTSKPPRLPTDQMPTWRVKWWWYPIPFLSIAIGSQVGRRVMAWSSAQRRRNRRKEREQAGTH